MEETIYGTDSGSVVQEILREIPPELVLVTSSEKVLTSAIEHLSQGDRNELLSVLSDHQTLKQTLADFTVGSVAADLIESGRLSLHETDRLSNEGTLFTNEDVLVSLVDAGAGTAALVSRDEEFTTAASKKYASIQARAGIFSIQTPPLSEAQESLKEAFGQPILDDFNALIDSQDNIRGDDDEIDEVDIALLVAARHELQLYEISKWGESSKVASKATFSRKKGALEANGLIETEKIPIDVGRPRLRLLLGNDRLRTVATDDMVAVAESLLEANEKNTVTA